MLKKFIHICTQFNKCDLKSTILLLQKSYILLLRYSLKRFVIFNVCNIYNLQVVLKYTRNYCKTKIFFNKKNLVTKFVCLYKLH